MPLQCHPKLIKNKPKKYHLTLPSFQYLFIHLLASVAAVFIDYTPFVQPALPKKYSLIEYSLIWFNASAFWYTIFTRPSVKLLSDILLLPQVIKILLLLLCRTRAFVHSRRSHMQQLLIWAKLRPRIPVWVVAELVSSSHWDHPLRQGADPALLDLCHWVYLSHTWGEEWSHIYPVALSSKWQGQLSQGKWLTGLDQQTWFLWPPGDNKSHGYQPRPYCMALSSDLGPDDTMAPATA